MLKKEIPDHHLIKLRGHLKQPGGNLKMQCDFILETRVIAKNNKLRDQLKQLRGYLKKLS